MFSPSLFLPDHLLARLTEVRVSDPAFSGRAAAARIRRTTLAPSGKLNLVAADHPARYITKVGDNPLAMADRRDYLARILRVVSSPLVDGVMATMDILEDLLSVDGFLREAGSTPLLDHKLLIASLNRGGLAGSAWELDDPITGATPASCESWGLDGAKFLLRIDLTESASLKTLSAATAAINECDSLHLPMFLEPLPVTRSGPTYSVVKNADSIARLVGVASALGASSRFVWLKLPYVENYELVARSTTMPILLLGGESAGDPAPFLRQLEGALRAGPNVRGALVGRNVLYPGDEDPLAMAEAAGGIVHQGWTVEQALQTMPTVRGRELDRLHRRNA